jgi:4-aminobutyrate aminotransferase-like enzyme
LDTISLEGLQKHALDMGSLLASRIEALRIAFPSRVGDRRGCGLFQGIEFIRTDCNPESGAITITEDEGLAEYVVDYLYTHQHIIASRDASVMKLKPPLVISAQDIHRLVDAVEEALSNAPPFHHPPLPPPPLSSTPLPGQMQG